MEHKISPGTGHSARCWRRVTASAAAATLLFTMIPVASAANGDGVTPTCDEAYYATTDYYGNLSKGSVVKSYTMNGKSKVTDYGTYKKVTNLTDDTKAEKSGDKTTFNFGKDVPDHFYFEGETSQPFDDLPWKLSLTYKLNGVPVKANKLKGKSGMVEIDLDMVPNKNASEYARNNYTLETMTAFNQNDILSLKADGAQVQLVGNLRMVLFVALPGEEQHVSIQVGTDDFQFDGITYLMVPATLSQLKQISELKEKKGQLETDYKKLNGSFDTLLNSINSMSSSLNNAADGLDEMGSAIGAMSAGAGTMYSQTDLLKADLGKIADALEPVATQMEEGAKALAETQKSAKKLVDATVSLKSELKNIRADLTKLQNDGTGVKALVTDTAALKSSLTRLQTAVAGIQAIQSGSLSNMNSATLAQVTNLGNMYNLAKSGDETDFLVSMFVPGGYTTAQATQLVTACKSGEAAANTVDPTGALWAKYQNLEALYTGIHANAVSFEQFCNQILLSQKYSTAAAATAAAQMNQLWTIYNGTDSADRATLEMMMGDVGPTLNANLTNANTAVTNLVSASSTLLYNLENLCDQLSGLSTALDDAGSTAEVIKTATAKGDTILDAVDSLSKTTDNYLPTAQKSLKTIGVLSTNSAKTMRDTASLISAIEGYAKQNGTKLTGGAKKSLNALSATLRSAASSLGVSGSVKVAKDDINGIITDTWEKYTGKMNNLLNMDAGADAESLTSDENAAPQSVQVLIRTHEIKTSDEGNSSGKEKSADKGTFWSRLAGVFTGIWKDITGKSDD